MSCGSRSMSFSPKRLPKLKDWTVLPPISWLAVCGLMGIHPRFAKITTRISPNPIIRIGIPGNLRLSRTNTKKTIKDAAKLLAASQSGSRECETGRYATTNCGRKATSTSHMDRKAGAW